jgi:flagellar basal-body rod modification protein FlgD
MSTSPVTTSDTPYVPPAGDADAIKGSGAQVDRKTGGTLGKDDFLKLMVKQMTTMDPLAEGGSDPSKMMETMTQFSILEQLTNLASNSTAATNQAQTQSAVALIGKTVTYPDATTGEPKTGVVSSVQTADGKSTLTVGDDDGIDPADILEVK